MTMIGFPPALETAGPSRTGRPPRYNRWSFQHLREVVPTAHVGRGTAACATAAVRPHRIGRAADRLATRRKSSATVAEVVADT